MFLALAPAMSAITSPTGMRRVNGRAINMPAEVAVNPRQTVLYAHAIALNKQFATIKAGGACSAGPNACAGTQFAQCAGNNTYIITACAGGLICAALPNVNAPGTSIACTTTADRDSRIADTGATTAGSAAPPPPPPTTAGTDAAAPTDVTPPASLTLDPSVNIQTGFQNDGQHSPVTGQTASLTSGSNFINFCALTFPATPLTNGQQITTRSCNGAAIGLIPSVSKMPSAKFVSPKNLDTVPANTNFTIQLAIKNLNAGFFTNAKENYFAVPQQLDLTGTIVGHTHIEAVGTLDSVDVTDASHFIFFKNINEPLVNGQVSIVMRNST
ncbi:hypothetical protein MVEN_01696000 [Mycena venus]|uniref:Carbohydrate-binding module family 19 domain-containing protein n=1 Tax=Mycena venus TaxID=2733690 RepID=A0A8H7CNA6_9AGAR|nr:hypothetical protein MVEN_01696000 [Mycena venus]